MIKYIWNRVRKIDLRTPAMACASNVFPDPGGPWSRKPRGAGSPMRL